jgi:hypothetical protein
MSLAFAIYVAQSPAMAYLGIEKKIEQKYDDQRWRDLHKELSAQEKMARDLYFAGRFMVCDYSLLLAVGLPMLSFVGGGLFGWYLYGFLFLDHK